MFKKFFLLLLTSFLSADISQLMRDLETVRQIDQEINDRLPFIYNNTFVGGYFSMPSARMNQCGTFALGIAAVPPYGLLNLNFQPFPGIELSGNVRLFYNKLDTQFGSQGFGDETDRTANVKISLLRPGPNSFAFLPNFAVGWNDFYGSRRFYSFYLVGTKQFLRENLELTLGWGNKNISGFFGGLAWTPFRHFDPWLLKGLTLLAEYDANHYDRKDEHPEGRKVNTRFNAGLALNVRDLFQVKVGSIRGDAVEGSIAVQANLGQSKGLFVKVDDPPLYTRPVNPEPIDHWRTEKDLGNELALSLCKQGFALRSLYLDYEDHKPSLWMKVINNWYREEAVVRDRVEHLLAALLPSNIEKVTVALEADGVLSQEYSYRGCDLESYRMQQMGTSELEIIAPRSEVSHVYDRYDGVELYRNVKEILIFTIRPRFITFFGSTTGKLKESVGLIAGPEGYLFDELYYKVQAAYNIYTSLSDVKDMDYLNPSHLPNVRSDTVNYFKSQTVTLEQAYIQKGMNLGKGWFGRCATGYFEPAFGGVALEFLYYPVNAFWAVGFEGAAVLKRKTEGLGFVTKVREYDGYRAKWIPYVGNQFFIDLYCLYKPWDVNFKVSAGKFLARDFGARFEFTRLYKSGLQFTIWTTLTNGNDHVNGHRYYDKGIAFTLPFDFFLKRSSRSYVGNAMSAWLRDVGAVAATGKPLFRTLYHERM